MEQCRPYSQMTQRFIEQQQALTNLGVWSSDNNIKFNALKGKFLSVTRKKTPISYVYCLGSEQVEDEKYLGVTVEELETVSENDPNSFWKLLKNMSDDFEDPSMSKPDVLANIWLTHFESRHAKHTLGTEQNNILQKLTKKALYYLSWVTTM